MNIYYLARFFFSSRRRHTRWNCDWSSDVCSSDLTAHTPDGEGFWSVATHADVLHVLKDAETYSSERGGERPYGGTLLQDLPVAGVVLNMMDDPRHARIRKLVST